MRYIPPFENIKQLLRFGTVRGETVVTMTYEEMQKVVRTLLSAFDIDEEFYMSQNPDVAQGVKDGTIQSARGHFIDHGYFEGRQASKVIIQQF